MRFRSALRGPHQWIPRWAAGLFLLSAASAGAVVQENAAKGERRLRILEYLERAPFSQQVFENLLETLDPLEGATRLSSELRERLSGDEHDESARVLLARLMEHDGRGAQACALLAGTPELTPDHRLLIGLIALRRNEPERALEQTGIDWIARSSRETAERALRLRAECWAELGELESATHELETLASTAPQSAPMALEVAALAEAAELYEAGAGFYSRAAELSTDVASRSRALIGASRALEQLGRIDEALEACARAAPLVGRGHWLRPELTARRLALHERAGSLDAFLDTLRATAEAQFGDPGAHEALARALEDAGRVEEAAQALTVAVRAFPDDRELSRRRRVLAALRGRLDEQLAELTRIVGRLPGDRELGFELAVQLSARGNLEAARRRFAALGRGLEGDASWFERVAVAWDGAGSPEEALRAARRALELAPRDVGGYLRQAQRLERTGSGSEVLALFAVAEEALLDSGPGLAEIARALNARGERAEASRVMQRALDLQPRDPHLRIEVAEWLIVRGLEDDAATQLRSALDLARAPSVRDRVLEQLGELIERRRDLYRRQRTEERLLEEQGETLAGRLLLAEIAERLEEPEIALEHLRAARDAQPDDEGVMTRLARTHEARGDALAAIAAWHELAERAPARRGAALRALHRLHAGRGDRETATRCLEDARRGANRAPEALLELARDFDRLGRPERARACLERVIQLRPDDERALLRLARNFKREGDRRGERRALVAAWKVAEGQARESAAKLLHVWLNGTRVPEDGLSELRRDLARDREGVQLFAELCRRVGAKELALETLDQALRRRPFEAGLLVERGRVLILLASGYEAVRDLERALELPTVDEELARGLLLRAQLLTGEVDRALVVAKEMGDPVAAAEELVIAHETDWAIRLLRGAMELDAESERIPARLANLCEEEEEHETAIVALEELARRGGADGMILRRIGDQHLDLGELAEAIDAGRRMIALEGFRPQTRQWFYESGLQRHWAKLRVEDARRLPLDGAALAELFEEAPSDASYVEAALSLARDLRHALDNGERPARHTALSWRRELLAVELDLLRRAETRRLELLEDLHGRRKAGRTLDERQWFLWLMLTERSTALTRSDRARVERALAKHPESELLLALAARRYEATGLVEPARAAWAELARLLRSDRNRAAELATRESAFAEHVERVGRRLPANMRRRLAGESLHELAELSFAATWDDELDGRLVRWSQAVRRELALSSELLDPAARYAEVRAEAGDEPGHAVWLAQAALSLFLVEEAREQVDRIATRELELLSIGDPEDLAPARQLLVQPWNKLAEEAQRVGRPAEAVLYLRRAGRPRAALAFVARERVSSQVVAKLREQFDHGRARFEQEGESPALARELHELGIALAEIEMNRAPLGGGSHRPNLRIGTSRGAQSWAQQSAQTIVVHRSGGSIPLTGAPRRPKPSHEAPAAAHAVLTELIEWLPDDLHAERALGRVAEHQSELDEARRHYERAIELSARVPAWLRESLESTRSGLEMRTVDDTGAFGGRILTTSGRLRFGRGSQMMITLQGARTGREVRLNVLSRSELEQAFALDLTGCGTDFLALLFLAWRQDDVEAALRTLERIDAAYPEFVPNFAVGLGSISYMSLGSTESLPILRRLAEGKAPPKGLIDMLVLALDEAGEGTEADTWIQRFGEGQGR